MTAEEQKEFIHGAVHNSIERNKECDRIFKLDDYPRWDYDQELGTLTFSDKGNPKVVAQFQVIGTESKKSKTWKWAWANETIHPQRRTAVEVLRSFGGKEGIDKLTDSTWPCDDYDGWEMTSIAVLLLGAKGSYRCPDENGYMYVVYTEIGFAS